MTLLICMLLAQDYFPLGEGYAWTYEMKRGEETKQLTKKVAAKEKVGDRECFIVEDQGMGGEFKKMYMAVEKDGIWVHRMRSEIEKPFQWLKLPPKKDEKWSDVLNKKDKGDSATVEFVTEAEEEVAVTAGKYKAWRVKMTGKESSDNPKTIELTFWYAPDVGEVKRHIKVGRDPNYEELDIQLVKFEKGK